MDAVPSVPGAAPASGALEGRYVGDEPMICATANCGEDITEKVQAKIDDRQKSIVFKTPRFGRRKKTKELMVFCSKGHLNIVDLK